MEEKSSLFSASSRASIFFTRCRSLGASKHAGQFSLMICCVLVMDVDMVRKTCNRVSVTDRIADAA